MVVVEMILFSALFMFDEFKHKTSGEKNTGSQKKYVFRPGGMAHWLERQPVH